MFEKVLIANRGEVALRIHRACHEMGIKTVVVHSTADSESMAVMLADESVCIGPPASKDSYLNIASILSAAHITGAQAIHPGIGFMAENATFAQMVAEHGLTFIGPSPEHIQVMGDKVSAKNAMIRAGVPVVPGSEGVLKNGQDATALAKEIGFPVLMKAAGGGGGKGMKIAERAEDVAELFDLAQIEAQTHFGNPDVYMEKYLLQPRHIEIQLLGDQHGNVIHLGERDCSLQRRHQKVLEEAPSPALTDAERAHIGAIAVKAAKDIGYYSAGTFEFLYAQGQFYFIEMNTRLQVEHCVTEAITGIDLVKEQPVLLREGGTEALVQHLDDFGQRRLFFLGLPGADVRRAVDALGLADLQFDRSTVHSLQAVVLQLHFVADLDHRVVTVQRQVRQQEAPVAVEHFQVGIGIRQDLAQKRIHPHVPAQLVAEGRPHRFVLDGLEAIHGRLQVTLHVGVIGRVLPLRLAIEDAGECFDFAPVVNLQFIQLVLDRGQHLRLR
jgi:biotin carboxylase